jgi:hypothetical protein
LALSAHLGSNPLQLSDAITNILNILDFFPVAVAEKWFTAIHYLLPAAELKTFVMAMRTSRGPLAWYRLGMTPT